ncbi:MAG: hypothetical protein AB7S78_04095 [Candidatus Omnitrophota bacterium]
MIQDQDPDVVPISDPKEIDDLKQTFVSAEDLSVEKPADRIEADAPDSVVHTENIPSLDEERPTLAVLPAEETREQESEFRHKIDQLTYRLKEQEENSKVKIFELTEDKRKLEDALRRELDSKEQSGNVEDDSAAKKDLENKLAQTETLIKSLTEENRAYNEQIQDQSDEINLLKNEIQSLQSEDKGGRIDPQTLKINEEKLLEAEGSVIRLMAENQRLNDQLHDQAQQIVKLQEEQKSSQNQAEEEIVKVDPLLLKEAQEKLTEAQGTITRLTEETQNLNAQIQQQIDRINELNTEAAVIRAKSEELEAQENIKLEALQHELESQKQQVFEERQGDLATINKLKNEKQLLIDSENQYKDRISGLESKIKDLDSIYLEKLSKQKLEIKAEQDSIVERLKMQCTEAQQKVADLEEQSQTLKENYEKKMGELSNELDSLRNSLLNQENTVSEAVAESQNKSEEIEREKQGLLQELQELKAKHEKIEANNVYLQEKEKILVYELSKSRAQALGLERICKDFKSQMDRGNV